MSIRNIRILESTSASIVPGRVFLVLATLGGMAVPATAETSVEQGPEVVVSASRVPLPASESGSAVTVITADEIARKQVRLVSDVLRDVPGIAVSRSGGAGNFTQIRIRGAESNHTLVRINGVELNDPSGASEFDFGNFLASDIERIEVLRGPQSALYGSDAIGGVINIITRKGRGQTTAYLDLEAGARRTGQISAGIRGGGDRYHYSLGGTGLTTDGVSVAPESEGNSETDGYRNQTYDMRLGATPLPNLDLELFVRHVNSTVETDDQPAVAGIIRTVDDDSETRTRQWTGRAQAKYTLFDGAWEHILGADYNEDSADSLAAGAVTFESEGEKKKFDYQTNVFFETPSVAGARHTVTLLAEREHESQVTKSPFGGSDLDLTSNGYVGEYRVGLWERVFLSGSMRYDDNEIFDDATTYRVTAAYLHEETATRLHGSYGTGVKNPTLFELFGFGPTFVPNPGLSQEKSKGWDIGVEQEILDGRATIDVTYFDNRITDLIQGAGNTAINISGTSRIRGIEVAARATLLEGLTLGASYTYTDGQDANGDRLIRLARHIASGDLNYAFADGRANVNLGVRYNGEQQDFQFSNFFINRDRVTLDDYVLVNVAASYRLQEHVELYARVENLLDEDYQEVLGFSNPGIGGFVGVRFTAGF
ncbi:TonB-dependent receptor plug domain-containing protein [Oceanibacterium hippocampi]|uniref:Colicin I receptor n=1 Tax=Oceanibacterium hippocampi TaxID=745714 RepID=A0A1Y5TY46_9PROT|nr:TonB-dependent receptor [Oceanibacterium hippocampi]SLN76682.1 Colicin I receptor precursor [Oceanibacterium hippocampi]